MPMPERLTRFLKNKYVLTVFAFFAWLLFFDNNDLIRQHERSQQLEKLKEERDFYKERTEKARNELRALNSDSSELERFARERYLMKKENEDIFMIVEEGDAEELGDKENLLENN